MNKQNTLEDEVLNIVSKMVDRMSHVRDGRAFLVVDGAEQIIQAVTKHVRKDALEEVKKLKGVWADFPNSNLEIFCIKFNDIYRILGGSNG